ncbi:hypothetical protein BKA64DRAFT_21989 [Cadophora sp. MPI-SDFR-AT-0126]|nr:hypothetical protein BKA64DRAFT_21989 [Leotiomycetes sp. MPI-SDFR-AT-0126]
MSATRPLTTFHPFLRVPKEIRLQIWRAHLTFFGSRTVTIRSDCLNDCERPLQYFRSSDPVPSVLHVCHEFRLEALSFYVPAFTNGSSPRFTWINFYHDTINLHDEDLCKVRALDKSCIRQLIIDTGSPMYFHGDCLGEFEPMVNLTKLRIISPQSYYAWDTLVRHMRQNFTKWLAHIPGYECPEIRIIQKGT